jgi:hypothetical protein
MGDRQVIDFESDIEIPDFESDIEAGDIGRPSKNVLERIGDWFKKYTSKPYNQWPGLTEEIEEYQNKKYGRDPEAPINKMTLEEVKRVIANKGKLPVDKDDLLTIIDPTVRVYLDQIYDSEEEAARLAGAQNMSALTGIDFSAYDSQTQIGMEREWLGADENEPVTTMTERMALQTTATIAMRNLITGLYRRKFWGDDSKELQAEIDELEGNLPPTDPFKGGFLEQTLTGTLNQMFGHYWKAAEDAGWGGFIGSVLGGAFGFLTAGPVGVAPGMQGGLLLGGRIGRRKAFGEYMVYSRYREALQWRDPEGMPMDGGAAKVYALTAGIADAFIEEMQWKLATKGGLIKTAVHRGWLKTIASNKFLSKIARGGAIYSGEMGEELLQYWQGLAQENIFKEVNNAVKGTEFATRKNLSEIMQGSWDTVKESAASMLLLSGGGMAFQELTR